MVKRLLLVGAGIAALCVPAIAQQAGAQQAGTSVSATTDLNIRQGPGSSYPIVGVIATDEAATLSGCTEGGDWCQVTAGGQQGWASSRYLTADYEGEQVVVVERRTEIGVPVTTYENDAGGELAGAATGATAGAVIGGPIGAAVGGAAGLAVGAIADPAEERIEYVRANPVAPVQLEGEAVVGSRLPEGVALTPIPDYEYQYVYVNGQPVLVDPGSREVVYVVR